MAMSLSKEQRSSEDYLDDIYNPGQGLMDGKPAQERYSNGSQKLYRKYGSFVLLQVLLLTCYGGVFLIWRSHVLSHLHHGENLVYSPAEEALKYEKVRFNATLVIESPYNGPPGPEVDEAWDEILWNMNMAVPGSDIRKIGTTSIPVPEREDTYIAGLGVFHELHCLKRLRQYGYQDYYFPNITADETRLNRLHTDHCIDVLRQAIMCRADISLFTLQWARDSLMPRADFSGEHECRNWDAINSWAGKHRIDLRVPGLLVHPLHGAAFPDGKGALIGGSEDHSPTVT